MTSESKVKVALESSTQGIQISFLSRFRRFLNNNGVLLLMALPGCVILFLFSYLPMPGIVLAFKNYKAPLGIWGSDWVGFANFQYLFSTGIAWRIIRNTLVLNSFFIVTTLVVSLLLAILLHEIHDKFVSRVYQSVLFFPYFVSYVIVGYFTFVLFSTEGGAINGLLTSLGLKPVNWYSNPNAWPPILVLVNLWHGVGYATIIYLAGIIAINPEYYEAARIDGANKWQEIWFIMLPLIRPLIIINVLLAVGRILFANFDLFINVIRDQGALLATTDVIDTYVFRALTTLGNFNMAAAASMFQATVGFALVVLSNWIVRRVDSDQALF
jgi:putative aldouronate transport system permease protein